MPHYRAHWLFSVGTLALLILILAACGGGSTSQNGTSNPTSASSPSASNSSTSTVKLTTSGGLTGTYSVSDQAAESNYNKSSSGTELQIAVNDSSWEFSYRLEPIPVQAPIQSTFITDKSDLTPLITRKAGNLEQALHAL